jgi:hypothetical protein
MWVRIGNFLWSIVRFLAPERAAYEVIIARYRATLEEERATFDAREREFRRRSRPARGRRRGASGCSARHVTTSRYCSGKSGS